MKVSETCFYAVQVLESVGVSRVHQEAWARSFQVVELLRYLHRNKLDKKKCIHAIPCSVSNKGYDYFFRIPVHRYIINLTPSPPPQIS